MVQSKTDLFEKAPIHKAYFMLTLPSVFGKIVMLFYNMADTWFIAATDNSDLVAGVSITTPIFMLMIAIGDIFGIGGSSVISRLFGKHQNEDVKKISSFCFYGAIGIGGIIAIILLLFQKPILHLLGAEDSIFQHALEYYRYIALGTPIIVASIVPVNILRCEGMATSAMIGSIVGSIVNIVLDPIFIFSFDMGAAGAAIATVIGNFCSLMLYIYFYSKSKWLSIKIFDCHIRGKDITQILSIGIPASLTNLMQSFCIALTNRCLLPFGNDKITAFGIASKVSMIANLLLVGFSFGAQPLIGYNYGNKNYPRFKKTLKFIYLFEISLAAVIAIVIGGFAPDFIRLFMDDSAIIINGAQILRFQLAGSVFVAVVFVSICIFQSTGKATASLLLAISRQGAIFALIMFISYSLFGYIGVLSAQPVSDLLTASIAMLLLHKELRKELCPSTKFAGPEKHL